jgi:hypothetical protein
VVGTEDERARKVIAEIYRPLYLNKAPILYTDRRTAELIKYAANAFLATKVTFINEIADLAEQVGADVQEVARGIGLDNRIGPKFLHPGPGYGGSCFPKDTTALVKTAHDNNVPLRVVEAVIAANPCAIWEPRCAPLILLEWSRQKFSFLTSPFAMAPTLALMELTGWLLSRNGSSSVPSILRK